MLHMYHHLNADNSDLDLQSPKCQNHSYTALPHISTCRSNQYRELSTSKSKFCIFPANPPPSTAFPNSAEGSLILLTAQNKSLKDTLTPFLIQVPHIQSIRKSYGLHHLVNQELDGNKG